MRERQSVREWVNEPPIERQLREATPAADMARWDIGRRLREFAVHGERFVTDESEHGVRLWRLTRDGWRLLPWSLWNTTGEARAAAQRLVDEEGQP